MKISPLVAFTAADGVWVKENLALVKLPSMSPTLALPAITDNKEPLRARRETVYRADGKMPTRVEEFLSIARDLNPGETPGRAMTAFVLVFSLTMKVFVCDEM